MEKITILNPLGEEEDIEVLDEYIKENNKKKLSKEQKKKKKLKKKEAEDNQEN